MAGVFEQKIRALTAALEHEDVELRESVRTTLRGFSTGSSFCRVVGSCRWSGT
jgi:hypothetical protein